MEILELDDNSENLIFTQYRKQRQAQAKAKMDKKMKVDDATQKRFITKGGKVRFAGVKSSSEASNAEKNSRRVHQMSESETEETTTSSTPSSHTQQDKDQMTGNQAEEEQQDLATSTSNTETTSTSSSQLNQTISREQLIKFARILISWTQNGSELLQLFVLV